MWTFLEKNGRDGSKRKKLPLLLQNLNLRSHDRYCNYISSRKPGEVSFDETVQIQTNILGEVLFSIHWKCLNLTKMEDEDFFTYGGVVSRECDKFKLEELSSDRFKCLIFVQGLISSRDSEMQAWILKKLEQDPKLTLQAVVDECNSISMKRFSKNWKKRLHTLIMLKPRRFRKNKQKKTNKQTDHQTKSMLFMCWVTFQKWLSFETRFVLSVVSQDT